MSHHTHLLGKPFLPPRDRCHSVPVVFFPLHAAVGGVFLSSSRGSQRRVNRDTLAKNNQPPLPMPFSGKKKERREREKDVYVMEQKRKLNKVAFYVNCCCYWRRMSEPGGGLGGWGCQWRKGGELGTMAEIGGVLGGWKEGLGLYMPALKAHIQVGRDKEFQHKRNTSRFIRKAGCTKLIHQRFGSL